MVSQVPLFLVIAESLLAFQASSYPELAGPDDADTEISAGDVDKIGSSASLAFFDDLLSYERAVEDDLAYRRQTVGVPFGYDLILESDEYMNVVCREAALIADRKSGHVGIVLGRPFVDSLVAAGTQRSLADQVRVFTYLVRISCKLVGSRGGVTGFGGDAVCFFRMIVGILRRLVRIVRLEIRDEADDYRKREAPVLKGCYRRQYRQRFGPSSRFFLPPSSATVGFCAIPSLRSRGKEPFSNRSTDGGCRG